MCRQKGCCATHDFCNANEAMQDVLGLINESWDIAKEQRFNCELPIR